MVLAISLARMRGDGLSPGSLTDFISHSTGRLCVRNKLTLKKQSSFSWSQSSLHLEWGCTIDFYSLRYLDCILRPLSTSVGGLRLISDFHPSISLLRNQDSKSDIHHLVCSHCTLGLQVCLNPCLITQQTGSSKKHLYSFSLRF